MVEKVSQMNFLDVIGILNQVGFYDFVLPWLLFFGIVFGLLQRTGIFGEDRGIIAIISAAIAFFVVNYTPVGGIAAYYSRLFGGMSMILSALLVLVLFVAIMGFEIGGGKGGIFQEDKIKYIVVAALVILAWIVYNNAYGGGLSAGISQETMTVLFVFGFILLVIWIAMRG